MNRGVDGQPVFESDEDRRDFCALLIEATRRFDVEVHAYCLMTNHFHLLVRLPAGGVSELMQWLTSRYAQRFNDRHDRTGHLFGSRFTSRLITTARYLRNVLRYIHRNALDLPNVRSLRSYRWSSHAVYLGRRPGATWMTTTLRSWFCDVDDYERFVDDDWGHDRAISGWQPCEIVAAIDDVRREWAPDEGRSAPAVRRAIAHCLADELPGHVRDALLLELGIDSPGARRTARTRARQLVAATPEVRALTDRVRELLGPEAVNLRAA